MTYAHGLYDLHIDFQSWKFLSFYQTPPWDETLFSINQIKMNEKGLNEKVNLLHSFRPEYI